MKIHWHNSEAERDYLEMSERDPLRKKIDKVIEQIKYKPIRLPISKKQVPKEYVEDGFKSVIVMDVDDDWRLIYSPISGSRIEIWAIVLDCFSHKEYDKKFGY